jgi:hypothetical protein
VQHLSRAFNDIKKLKMPSRQLPLGRKKCKCERRNIRLCEQRQEFSRTVMAYKIAPALIPISGNCCPSRVLIWFGGQ